MMATYGQAQAKLIQPWQYIDYIGVDGQRSRDMQVDVPRAFPVGALLNVTKCCGHDVYLVKPVQRGWRAAGRYVNRKWLEEMVGSGPWSAKGAQE